MFYVDITQNDLVHVAKKCFRHSQTGTLSLLLIHLAILNYAISSVHKRPQLTCSTMV